MLAFPGSLALKAAGLTSRSHLTRAGSEAVSLVTVSPLPKGCLRPTVSQRPPLPSAALLGR